MKFGIESIDIKYLLNVYVFKMKNLTSLEIDLKDNYIRDEGLLNLLEILSDLKNLELLGINL